MVKHITSDSQYTTELSKAGSKLVVVDFFADWCGPCKMLTPIFEQLEAKYDKAISLKVDVDQCQDTARNHSVSAMPTILCFKDGKQVGKVVGANPSGIQAMIDANYVGFESFKGTGRKLTDAIPSEAASGSAPAAAPAATSAAASQGNAEGDCDIQVRLQDGGNVRSRFSSSDTLQAVHDYVAGVVGTASFALMTNFPKKVYEGAELARTLKEEGLAPRGQLIITRQK